MRRTVFTVALTLAVALSASAQDNAYDVQSVCGSQRGNYEYGVYLNLYASQLMFSTRVAGEALSGIEDDRELALYTRDAVMAVVSLRSMVLDPSELPDPGNLQKPDVGMGASEAALSAFSGIKDTADEAGLTSLSETQSFMIDFGVDAASAIASGNPWELVIDQSLGILINSISAFRYYSIGEEIRVYDAVGQVLFPYFKSCGSIPYTAAALGYNSGYPSTRTAFFEWVFEQMDDEYGLFEGFDPDAALLLATRFADEVPPVASSILARISTPSQSTPILTDVVPGALVGSTGSQTVTVRGTGFGPATSATYSDGSTTRNCTTTYVDASTLRCGLSVGTSAATWTLQASNGSSGSNPDLLRVESAPDVTAPAPPRDFNVFPLYWANENSLRAVWENPEDPTGIARVWYRVGAPPTSPQDGTPLDAARNSPLLFSLPSDRSDFVHVWLEDGEGNVDHSNRVSVPVRLDLDAPSLDIITPGSSDITTDRNQITVSGTVADATSGVSRVVWLSSPLSEAGIASVDADGAWTATDVPLAPGANEVVLVAADLAGNVIAQRLAVVSNISGGTSYRLDLSTSGSGTIQASPDQSLYPAGSNVSLTAIPGDGYTFSGWSGHASGRDNPLTITMNADKAITARFTQGREQGAVTVTILPADAVSAGAQWRYRDNPWMESGETYIVNFPGPGSSANVEILFRDIDGWRTPAPIRFLLPYGESRSVVSEPYIRPTPTAGSELTNSNFEETDLFGSSLALGDDWAVISTGNHDKAYTFRYDGQAWLETQQLDPNVSDPRSVNFFGSAVDLDGSTLVVGAAGSRPEGLVYSGDVHVFSRFGSDWLPTARVYPDEPEHDEYFGYSVALDDRVLAVGAFFKDIGPDSPGAAYVFRSPGSDNTWIQEQILYPPAPSTKRYFGHGLDVEGDVLVIGGETVREDGGADGTAYVYRYDGSAWILEQEITSPEGEQGDVFAGIRNGVTPLALSQGRLVVSAPYADVQGVQDAGAVYVYQQDGTTGRWEVQSKLSASDAAESDRFGTSVSIDGDVILIGAPGHDLRGSSSGAAYVFRWIDGAWIEYERLSPEQLRASYRLGKATALRGDRALAGAPGADLGGVENRGAVYVSDLTYNSPPSEATLTYPPDGYQLNLAADATDGLPITWSAGTDGENDALSYVWRLAASADGLDVPLLNSGPTAGTSHVATRAAIDDVLDQLGVGDGGSVTLVHRVDVTDGISVTPGAKRALTVIRDVGTSQEDLPQTFAFRGLSPNPVSDVLRLAFDLPEPTSATIEVFDALGRRVRHVHVDALQPGSARQLGIDCRGLSAGVYLVRAGFGTVHGSLTRRFTVIR